jgi:hypothetical protein
MKNIFFFIIVFILVKISFHSWVRLSLESSDEANYDLLQFGVSVLAQLTLGADGVE